jgi:outer membrane murein-binding lipoprotein Lpp
MKIKRMALAAAIMAVLIMAVPVLAGCGSTAKYSDPIAENILVSMNNGDYAGFSRDFDANMKSQLGEAAFPGFLDAVNGQVGNYIADSKKITGVNIENGLTTATYTADFEFLEDVTVDVVYQKIGGEMKVVGLWFN